MKDKKVLVTGAFGFLGENITNKLIKKGALVTAIYLKNKKPTKASTVQCDLTNTEQVKELLKTKYDYIIHLAGQPTVWYSNKYPLDDFKKNVLTTINLLEAAKNMECTFVYSSSSSLYPQGTSTEDTKVKLDSFYAKNKYFSEKYIEEYTRKFAINGKIVRFSFIYGPKLKRNPIYDALKNTNHIRLYVSNDSKLDFIYVDDAAEGLIYIAKSGNNEVYNISSGKGTRISELMKMIQNERKNKMLVSYSEKKQEIILDNKKIEKLGWIPLVNMKTGLKKTINWFNNYI